MSTETATPPATEPHAKPSADERRAEAADVLAETLLDMWLSERRARRDAALHEPRAGGRSV